LFFAFDLRRTETEIGVRSFLMYLLLLVIRLEVVFGERPDYVADERALLARAVNEAIKSAR
jgi:hypothetical protein